VGTHTHIHIETVVVIHYSLLWTEGAWNTTRQVFRLWHVFQPRQ